jgi:thiosulfate/3-mercaptopyruvate sulfurtransferase
MPLRLPLLAITVAVIGLTGFSHGSTRAQEAPASTAADGAPGIPSSFLIQPSELAQMVQAQQKPVILQVGSHVLYAEAHMAGAEYIGAAKSPEGIAALQERLSKLSKDQVIVIYCGCCPWVRCPNIRPAYEQLHAMGFKNVKVLYVENNFGKDWVDHGYPTDKGR